MELIPIIIKILTGCVLLFFVVLVISMLFSKPAEANKTDYKRIVKERKIAYSQQLEHINSQIINPDVNHQKMSFHKKVNDGSVPNYNFNRGRARFNSSEFSGKTSTEYKKPFENKQRYTILNETMKIEPVQKYGNKEVKIFYPINFQRSA